MNVGGEALFGKKRAQDLWIACRDPFVGDVFYPVVFKTARHRKRQSAPSKAEHFDRLQLAVGFGQNVLPDNARISHAILYILRNIVIAKKQYFKGKIIRGRAQLARSIVESDVAPS